jgi:hypothetical protein
VGGFVAREFERRRTDPSLVAQATNARRRDAQLLAELARDHCTLRLPLPDVLGYARAWRDSYGSAVLYQQLWELNAPCP